MPASDQVRSERWEELGVFLQALVGRGWVARRVRMTDYGDQEVEVRLILTFDRSKFTGFL